MATSTAKKTNNNTGKDLFLHMIEKIDNKLDVVQEDITEIKADVREIRTNQTNLKDCQDDHEVRLRALESAPMERKKFNWQTTGVAVLSGIIAIIVGVVVYFITTLVL